jgi:malate dehydrogenase (oxaloacetate-decarboxylating)(NADP+)
MDSKGLITDVRHNAAVFEHHKHAYAHPCPSGSGADDGYGKIKDILSAIDAVKPTVLIGVSARPKAFTEEVVRSIAQCVKNKYSARSEDGSLKDKPTPRIPTIMALSNPTSKAECTAEQAYQWTNGDVVYMSGSPFDPVTLEDGRTYIPGQGNNAYIFPGVGLGARAALANSITDDDFLVAAKTLSDCVDASMLAEGRAYPPLSHLTTVSRRIALAVARNVMDTGRSSLSMTVSDAELDERIGDIQYDPFRDYHTC